MKSLTGVISPSLQDIENELYQFYPHKISFTSFFINTVHVIIKSDIAS
jgi:hypothetical protein